MNITINCFQIEKVHKNIFISLKKYIISNIIQKNELHYKYNYYLKVNL